MSEGAELPRWCHMEVRAAKITVIDQSDGGATLLFGDIGGAHNVNAEYIRINPKLAEGGYYVVYADGYESYSPAEAFEEGYTLITDEKPKQQNSGPRFHPNFYAGERCLTVDEAGVPWWVDPEAATIRPAVVKESDDNRRGIGWAVKQLHCGSKVSRAAWRAGELSLADGIISNSNGGGGYSASSADLLALDWEISQAHE